MNAWASAVWAHARDQHMERRQAAAVTRQEQVAAAVGDPSEWTMDQVEEHLFGDMDRQAAERKARYERSVQDGTAVGHGRGWGLPE